ncbi:hypothetical protein [Micromonospora sp. NPDC050200]|uniref:hypothetical protein n=1 Tax=Micromonospora sp. NPDC050200 TaxID=3155664 RepID=UPI0033C40FA8
MTHEVVERGVVAPAPDNRRPVELVTTARRPSGVPTPWAPVAPRRCTYGFDRLPAAGVGGQP